MAKRTFGLGLSMKRRPNDNGSLLMRPRKTLATFSLRFCGLVAGAPM